MRFKGTAEGDSFDGTEEGDRILGLGGSDFLHGHGGSDRIEGGDGDDYLVTNGVFDSRFGNASADLDAVADTALGGAGDDVVVGGWNDTLAGGEGYDALNLDLRGAAGGATVDLSALATGGRARNGAGWLSGFEAYGLIIGSDAADDLRVGGLQASEETLFPGIYAGAGDDRVDARAAAGSAAPRFGYQISGEAGNDVLIGNSLAGNSLYGDEGADRLVAGDRSDALYGGDGDDLLDARGFGSDLVDGGDGDDVLALSGRRADWTARVELRDAEDGGESEIVVYLSREQQQPNGASGRRESVFEVETVRFGKSDFTLGSLLTHVVIGTDGDDVLAPGTTGRLGTHVTRGDDTLYGAGGSDVLDGGAGADTLYGGDGGTFDYAADTFLLRDVGDRAMDAGEGDMIRSWVDVGDNLSGGFNGRPALIELMGSRDLDASAPVARIVGNAGNNHLTGLGVLEGGAGDDVLEGYGSSSGSPGTATASYEHTAVGVTVDLGRTDAQDTVGAGRDTLVGIRNLTGSAHDDTLAGSASDDVIAGGLGADRIDGREGHDTVSYADAAAGVTVDLSVAGPQETGGGGRDTLVSVEVVIGTGFADRLSGGAGNDQFGAGAGSDVLSGGAGDDQLDGGAGKDVLRGGAGNDYLIGGADADRFAFDDGILDSTFSKTGLSSIADFDRSESDRIDLSAVDADRTRADDQAFTFVDAFTRHAGELTVRFLNDGAIKVFSGDVDGDGRADFDVGFGSTTTFVPEAAFVL